MVGVSVVVELVVFFLYLRGNALTCSQHWSIYCVVFLLAWWIVYFHSRAFKIWTLRIFLDDYSVFRHGDVTSVSGKELTRAGLWVAMKDKSQSTTHTMSILIAVVSLFLSGIFQITPLKGSEEYYRIMNTAADICAILAIICSVWAIDLLDSVSNVYSSKQSGKSTDDLTLEFAKHFYRGIGPGFPSGGISYAYLSFALFSLFVVIAVAARQTWYSGIGVAAFVYLGYPFLFGYVRDQNGDGNGANFDRSEINAQQMLWRTGRTTKTVASLLALSFLALTLLVENRSAIMNLL